MRRAMAIALVCAPLVGCYRSHERAAWADSGPRRDAGSSDDGALRDGAAERDGDTAGPVDELPGSLAHVCMGVAHACAALDDGSVYCWGHHHYDTISDAAPVRIEGLPPVRRVRCSNRFNTCVVADDGAVYCWGRSHGRYSTFPALAGGTTEPVGDVARRPLRMDRVDGATDVLMGAEYTCAVRETTADCWGWDWRIDEPFFERGIEVGDIVYARAHSRGACVLRSDGTAVMQTGVNHGFGARPLGEAGAREVACSSGDGHAPDATHYDGCVSTATGRYACGSVMVTGALAREPVYDGFARIAIGLLAACGVRLDGRVECRAHDADAWGELNAEREAWFPIDLPEPAVWIDMGSRYACALTESGELWCWGALDGSAAVLPPARVSFTR